MPQLCHWVMSFFCSCILLPYREDTTVIDQRQKFYWTQPVDNSCLSYLHKTYLKYRKCFVRDWNYFLTRKCKMFCVCFEQASHDYLYHIPRFIAGEEWNNLKIWNETKWAATVSTPRDIHDVGANDHLEDSPLKDDMINRYVLSAGFQNDQSVFYPTWNDVKGCFVSTNE